MIPENESMELKRRVGDLEEQVRNLRTRVATLEGGSGKVALEPPVKESPPASGPAVCPATPPGTPVPPPLPPPLVAATQKHAPPPPVPPSVRLDPPRLRTPPEPSPVEKALRALHLLPPGGEGSGEVQLGAWWATRIGAVVFVIGVVFAGVYLTLATPPWVKLAELAAVSIGVCFAGRWLERKVPQFGAVIVGAGLALVYFTAFAAYAVPAVKVVDNTFVAAGLQVAAVSVILFAAVRRQSPTVATMAVLLGYVTAFGSIRARFDDFAIWGSLALLVVGLVFRLRRSWAVPLATSAVLHHGLYMMVAWLFWGMESTRTSPWTTFLLLGLGFTIVLSSLLIEHRRTGESSGRAQRWIQGLNTPLAVLAGFVAAVNLLPDNQLSWYFFGAGAVLAAVGAHVWRTVPREPLFGMFVVKASALIALGVATEWGTRTRWVVLFVEAFVLLAAAKRTRRPVMFVTAVGAWSAAMYFFGGDVWLLDGLLLTWAGLAAAVVVVATPVFWLLTLKWWPGDRGTPPAESRGLFAIIAGLPLFLYCPLFVDESWGALGTFLIATVLAGIARWARSIIPLVGSVAAFGFAQYILHTFDSTAHGLNWMWASVTILAVAAAAAGWWAAEVEAPTREASVEGGGRISANGWRSAGAVLQTLALAAVFVGVFEISAIHQGLGIAAVISAIVVCTAVFAGRSVSAASGVFALAIACVMALARFGSVVGPVTKMEWLWLVAASVPVILGALGGATRVREELEGRSWFAGLSVLCLPIGIIALPIAATDQFGPLGFVWTMIAGGAVYFGVGVVRRIGGAFIAATAVLAFALFSFALADMWEPALDGWWALISAMVATFAFGTLPVLTRRYARWVPAVERSFWSIVHVVIATLCVIRIAIESSGPWESYGSVVWALGGIGLFVFGLFFRSRPHRIAGLVTLALCIPRVFMVDINSTLYRIAAFVVLGAVILWVGFSYQRFRHFIEDKDVDDDTNPPANEADQK